MSAQISRLSAAQRYGILYKKLSKHKRGGVPVPVTHNQMSLKQDWQLTAVIDDTMKTPLGVTKILAKSQTLMQQQILKKWAQEKIDDIGQEAFDTMMANIVSTGTKTHSEIENAANEKRSLNPNASPFIQSIIDDGIFDRVDTDYKVLSECQFDHPLFKYRGIIDMVAVVDGKMSIIDWKTSQKLKTQKQDLFDEPLQVAAYTALWNANHPDEQIEQAILVIKNFKKHASFFLKRNLIFQNLGL